MSRLVSTLYACLLGLVVLVVSFGLDILAFGWTRFLADFWPLDASRVGPNIVASAVMVVLLVAHSEFVTERRAADRHETHKQMFADLLEAANPVKSEEEAIAAKVEARWKADVLDRLDPTTPGGIAELLPKDSHHT